MIFLKNIGIILAVIIIIAFGMFIGFKISEGAEEEYNQAFDNNMTVLKENVEVSLLEISNSEEEKTTPNTLMIYKTYYTKCKHYVQEYKNIDASLVNLTDDELKEKNREWDIEETFCNQHYKIIVENNVIVIYIVDENGIETEYEQTGITTEYLTREDILKLTSGIYIYGKENLTSTIEDYE